MYKKELLIEGGSRCSISEDCDVRLIFFDVDEDGCKQIFDIAECKIKNIPFWVNKYNEDGELELIKDYEDFNFGRAKKISTKAVKIAQSLMVK